MTAEQTNIDTLESKVGQSLNVSDSPTFQALTLNGDLIAENFIVSSSVTYMTQSFSSGSTIFGDDINDIVVRPLVSLLFTPFNASEPLKSISDFGLQNAGGYGAVRELAERILQAKRVWPNYSKNGWIKRI